MNRRILLADDSVTIQKVIELTFMDEDFEVTAVSNGDEAVALLPQLQPDFVIADVHMPGANGYEVCRRAKAFQPQVPVLLLVGTFEPFDEGQARSAGSDAFLKKPFDSQELLHLVQQLLEQPAAAAPAPAAATAPSPFPAAAAVPTVPTPIAPPETSASGRGWAEFELEAEPEPEPLSPMPATSPPPPAAPAGFTWSPPTEEPVFELEPADEVPLDEALLAAEPFPGFGAKTPAVESPAEEPFSAGAGGLGSGLGETELVEAHAPWSPPRFPEATPDERAGVPEGAAPLAESLAAVEQRIEEHAEDHAALPELPDWESPPIVAPPAAPTPPPVAAPAPALGVGAVSLPAATPASPGRLSDEDVDRIARRLVELVGEKVVRDVAWEVIPDLAEVVIKDRLRELEGQVE